jgi:hypothetical protein
MGEETHNSEEVKKQNKNEEKYTKNIITKTTQHMNIRIKNKNLKYY